MFSYQANPQVVNELNKTGTIKSFGGSTPPDGWLFCDGSAISRTTYAELFAVIGTTYGSGDGSTTFNLPNIQNIITAVTIPSSIAVYGNGKCIGVYSSSSNTAGLASTTRSGDAKGIVGTYSTAYNVAVGGSYSGSTNAVSINGIGITTDTSGKSGIVAKSSSITRTTVVLKHVIKY